MKKFRFTKNEEIYLLLALFVLVLLFISSSMTYHQQEMKSISINHHLSLVEKLVGNWNIYYGGKWHNAHLDGGVASMTEFVIRKAAHFSSYFLVGLFAYLGLKRIFKINWLGPLFIWLTVIGLAAFDEFHQFLTGDRTPSVHDIMLDGAGALTGILLCLIGQVVHTLIMKKKSS